ncbi:hypothetical protein NDU88_007191 [Pleurodeles waltl]|uniref:Uncharacterized protein n=1 Tax=Pleurodeles waltl TaxID=8319 RepID=A0AAV7LRB9_PLEWA|nr:hypothetical protein NDU88_007191 [Pleurodeles waltl]
MNIETWLKTPHAKSTLRHRGDYYVGDKAGRILAWLEKRDQAQSWVLRLTTDSGEVKKGVEDIAAGFATYYSELYKARNKRTKRKYENSLGTFVES